MVVKKITAITKAEEASAGSGEENLPDDIDLENRKNIIRAAIDEIRGKLIKAQVEENRRIKTNKFSHSKKRKKMAQASLRKNRG